VRPRHVVYAAPVVLWVLAMLAAWASPAVVGVCLDDDGPKCHHDPSWVTYAAYVLWALAVLGLVLAVIAAAVRGVRRFWRLSRTPVG
jgi:hypothetical protein